MPQTVTMEAIRAHLPHVDADNLGGRSLSLYSLRDENGEWQMWLPDGNGGLFKVIATPVESCYFAKEPASESDIRLFFIEFLDQRASYPKTRKLARAAYSDVQNLAASLAKLELIFAARDNWPGTSRMAATELEYIFLNCRSLFDLFQEVVLTLWGGVKLLDESLRKRNLPPSFRRMVLQDDRRMSVEEIVAKHQIPTQLAEAYHSTGQFFEWLRQYRDYIAHSGRDFECVFVAENGFAISTDAPPFSSMKIWCDANTLQNNLGSLKSAACHVVLTTLSALETIILSFQSVIQFLPPLVPGYSIFICGPNIKHLAQMAGAVKENPWYSTTRTVESG